MAAGAENVVETDRRDDDNNIIQDTGVNLRTEGLKTEMDTEIDAISNMKDLEQGGTVDALMKKMNRAEDED